MLPTKDLKTEISSVKFKATILLFPSQWSRYPTKATLRTKSANIALQLATKSWILFLTSAMYFAMLPVQSTRKQRSTVCDRFSNWNNRSISAFRVRIKFNFSFDWIILSRLVGPARPWRLECLLTIVDESSSRANSALTRANSSRVAEPVSVSSSLRRASFVWASASLSRVREDVSRLLYSSRIISSSTRTSRSRVPELAVSSSSMGKVEDNLLPDAMGTKFRLRLCAKLYLLRQAIVLFLLSFSLLAAQAVPILLTDPRKTPWHPRKANLLPGFAFPTWANWNLPIILHYKIWLKAWGQLVCIPD